MSTEQERSYIQQQVGISSDHPQIVTLEDSTDNGRPEERTNTDVNGQGFTSSIDVEIVKDKVEAYDMDAAINDLTEIITRSSEMFYELKKIKFEYLSQAFELYSRIDFPSLMMMKLEHSMSNGFPTPNKIEQLSDDTYRNEQPGA